MHEFGIASSALNLVLEHARRENATRVHQVILRVGSLSGVDSEALRFAFGAVTAGTLVENAELVIERIRASAHCHCCGKDFGCDDGFVFECPDCGQLSSDIRQGRELELARIELSA